MVARHGGRALKGVPGPQHLMLLQAAYDILIADAGHWMQPVMKSDRFIQPYECADSIKLCSFERSKARTRIA